MLSHIDFKSLTVAFLPPLIPMARSIQPHYTIWWAALIGMAFAYHRRGKRSMDDPAAPAAGYFGAACILAGIIAFLLVASNKQTINPHHVNFPNQFFAGAFSYYLFHWLHRRSRQTIAIAALSCLILTMGNASAVLTRAPQRVQDTPQRFDVLDVARYQLPSDAYIVYVDWGMYYLGSLFANRGQLIAYSEPPDWNRMRDIMKRSKHPGMYVIGITASPNLDVARYTGSKVYPGPGETGAWEIWYIPAK